MKRIDFKTLVIGLLLGVCSMLVLAAVKADPAGKADADYRYQISAMQEGNATYLFILDHETKKVYKRQYDNNNGQGFDLKKAITQAYN